MTYGQAAKRARLKSFYSVMDLSRLLGINSDAIRLLEANRRLPMLDAIQAIAKALNVSLNEYLGIQPSNYFWEEREEGESIYEFMKMQRKSRFLSPERLALMADVSPCTIRKIESGETNPRTATVIILAKALGLSPDEYLGNPCPFRRHKR